VRICIEPMKHELPNSRCKRDMRRTRVLARNGRGNAIRALLLSLTWMALYAYAGRPLLVAAHAGGMGPAAAWSLLVALSLLPPLALVLGRKGDSVRIQSVLQWTGYATMAVFSLLIFFVLGGDILRVSYWLVGLLLARLPEIAARLPILDLRRFDLAILGAVSSLSVVGLIQARRPAVKRVRVPIEGLPAAFEGFRIAQLSDVHVSPTIKAKFVETLVRRTNALGADAIAITGDLVDGHLDDLREQVQPLSELSAPDGVFYVTGNHEYYWRVSEWLGEIERLGLIFLKNDHRVIRRGCSLLVMAGVTDPVGRHSHRPDAEAALGNAPHDAIRVLLAHRPQAVDDAQRLGVHLQLSGHTHGGQFFPFNLLIRFFQPVVSGLHRLGSTWLYVSRGTGYWGPPSRLGVGGEITLLELHAA
jgi:predicted MPP superfamily phosphohydrolase